MKQEGIIKYLKFPLQFDAELMLRELQAIIENNGFLISTQVATKAIGMCFRCMA